MMATIGAMITVTVHHRSLKVITKVTDIHSHLLQMVVIVGMMMQIRVINQLEGKATLILILISSN